MSARNRNPKYLVTAKQKTVRDVDLGILEDKSAAKALTRAKTLYSGKGYTDMKAKRRNPDKLTDEQIEKLPRMQSVHVANDLMSAWLRGESGMYAVKNSDGSVTVHGENEYGAYAVTYDKKGKLKNPRRNKTIIRAGRIDHLDVSRVHNPGKTTRRKYRNGYLDLVIRGQAKKTPSGWLLGGKTFKQGKGIVSASKRGYYLDLGTGTVFSKKARNVAQGFFDGNGVFHPIRSSSDYDGGKAGETGKKPVRTRSKKRKASFKKASQTARLKAETARRKSTTSRLASRSLSRSAGILKGSGSRRQRKNPEKKWNVFYIAHKPEGHEVQRQKLSMGSRIPASSEAEAIAIIEKRYGKAGKKGKYFAVLSGYQNPSVKTIRKEFAGTLGKASDVFAPIGTPRNVAKLGKLLLIDTEKATIKPTGIVYLCADSKGKLHLCGSKNVPIYSGAAQSFGRVKKLEYETAKPHLYPGQGTIQFWHKMGEESGNRPTLYADGKGGLKFRGGSYKITREGIVD